MYRPNPLLTIKPSEIAEGQLGVFAAVDVEAKRNLGTIRVQTNREIYRTGFGPFGNHSDSPNCKTITVEEAADSEDFCECIISRTYLVTETEILAGEEITWIYTLPEYDNAEFISR